MPSIPSGAVFFQDGYHNLTACFQGRDIASAIGEWILQDQARSDFTYAYFNSIRNTAQNPNYDSDDDELVNISAFLPHALHNVVMIVVLSHVLHLFLRHLGQPRFVSQLISGILINLFMNKGRHDGSIDQYSKNLRLHNAITGIGQFLNLFLLGLKMDVGSAWCGGENPVIIAVIGFSIPMMVTFLTFFCIPNQTFYRVDSKSGFLLLCLIETLCHSFFFVQAEVLSDLGLLSSELGRLALSTSLIQDTMFFGFNIIVFNMITQSQLDKGALILHLLFYALMILFIVLVVRPYAVWIVRNTPTHAHVSEVHITLITIIVTMMALASDFLGTASVIGPIFMGLALPCGPPLGTALIRRLDYVATEILFPLTFICAGYQMDWVATGQESRLGLWLVFLMLVMSISKFASVAFAASYCGFSIQKGAILGLIMNFKGITETLVLIEFKTGKAINGATYTYMVLIMITMTSISALLVSIFYKPLDVQLNVCKNVRDLETHSELRILTYFFDENPIASLIDLFEWLTSPIAPHSTCVYALHLEELKACLKSKLISHHIEKNQIDTTDMHPIHYHFLNFAKGNEERLTTKSFTSIVPRENLHQDICSLVVEEKIALVLLPFPRKNSIASTEADQRERSLIPLVLEKAQCSVGIMVYQNMTRITRTLHDQQCRIGVFFMGGPDDREAVAIAHHMAYHPSVHLRILRICICIDKRDEMEGIQAHEKMLDDEAIDQMQRETASDGRLIISEVTVDNPTQIFLVIRSLRHNYDMLIVGRRRVYSSSLDNDVWGKWTEAPELGVIGDLLASSDFETSANILVVQQHDSS